MYNSTCLPLEKFFFFCIRWVEKVQILSIYRQISKGGRELTKYLQELVFCLVPHISIINQSTIVPLFQLIYTCGPGHVASGSLSRECQLGGTWSGTEPVCTFVDCGSPEELVNGSFELVDGRTTYGAEIKYTCGADYTVSGDTTRR